MKGAGFVRGSGHGSTSSTKRGLLRIVPDVLDFRLLVYASIFVCEVVGEGAEAQTWRESRRDFKAEVAAWAERIKQRPKEIHVRPMTTKWGSCSTAGRVTFDLDLLAQPHDFRKEVIVHELLHLKCRTTASCSRLC